MRPETRSRRALWAALGLGLVALAMASPPARAGELGEGLHFTEVAAAAGVRFEHALPAGQTITEPLMMHSGVAAGDLDGDGWPDLVAVRGPEAGNGLYKNRRDGTFEEVGDQAGLRLAGAFTHGVAMADVDGDGDLDVLFGAVAGDPPRLFRNRGDSTFEPMTAVSGLVSSKDTFSAAFADIDLDGDLDLFLAHWSGATGPQLPPAHLWRNDGTGFFSPIDFLSGIAPLFEDFDWSFTPAFADLDGDGDPDLLLAADFGTSQVLRNDGDGGFEIVTGEVISDENGMGAAVGDFDGDGLWDWFVTSIWDPDGVNEGNWGLTGNRLYRGLGDGTFADATEASGVRQGYWGWGSCAGDFDLDGDLDLFHVNGFPASQAGDFHDDPARLFLNAGDGTFVEASSRLGVADTGQGRGVICFDYDLDGDLDLFVANNRGPSRLFRNELIAGGSAAEAGAAHWLSLDLRRPAGSQPAGNRFAVGAEVRLLAGGRQQLRQVRAGSNFLSQDPLRLHFGLGTAAVVDQLEIRWPGGQVEVLHQLAADRHLRLVEGGPPPVDIPALDVLGSLLLAVLLLLAGVAGCRK